MSKANMLTAFKAITPNPTTNNDQAAQDFTDAIYDNLPSSSAVGVVPIGAIIAWHKTFPNTPALPAQFVECNGQVIADIESDYDGQTIPDYNGDKRFIRGGAASGGLEADSTAVNGLSNGNQSASHNHTTSSVGNQSASHNHTTSSVGNQSASHQHTITVNNNAAAQSHTVNDPGHTHNVSINSGALGPAFPLVIALSTYSDASYALSNTTGITVDDHPVHNHTGSAGNQDTNHNHTVSLNNQSASHTHTVTLNDQSASHTHTLSGDAETRPINVTMVWVMRIK